MPEVREPLAVVEVDMTCEVCGEGRMRPTGYGIESKPPKYEHRCSRVSLCNGRAHYPHKYPFVTYESAEKQS